MRIDEGLHQHWTEPHEAELFQPLRDGREQAAAHDQGTTAPPPEPPPTAFWEPVPVQANALNDLPPAPQAQAAEETAATISAQATAAPANSTTGTAAATYAGELPADPQWLLDREKALVAIRADYTAARTQADSTAGMGPGWVVASTVTDESGAPRSASGRALVFVPDPTAPQVIAGHDESGLPIHQSNGQWMEFDEAAFAAHYRAQGGTHLQSLATLYDTDVAGLFGQHPEIWGIATGDHAINAGPPPAGRAMGDPGQLAMLDLYMRDPQMAALIDAYGGQPAPATGDIAREQVRIHGQQRYEQLSRLDNAMASVRQQYADAMTQAQASGTGPGWVERARTVTVSDESGRTSTQTLYVTDESGQPLRDASGQPQAQMERLFDPDVFTAWYVQQGGLQHQAFKDFYGQSHTTFATDESGRSVAAGISFDNPNWSMAGIGGMVHKELVGIDPNDPPRLHDRGAVGFDLEAGWATHHSNIKPERDWFETVIQVAMVAVVSYISAGQLGPAAASAMGLTTTAANGAVVLTTAGVMVSGALAGAATSLVSGMMSGNLTFKGVLQGALAGGLSAGLIKELGPIAAQAGPVGTLALRTTVQGGIQALLGGEFKDGALAGFASGLADLAGANMKANIDKAEFTGAMTPAEAAVARNFARIVGSAIRAAGNPDDPAHAFASSFVNDLLEQAVPPPPAAVTRLAFDDDGHLNPGIVDPNASFGEQMAQLRAQLQAQGLPTGTADMVVGDYAQRVLDEAAYSFLSAQPDPVLVAGVGWTTEVRGARQVIDNIESRIADGSLRGDAIGAAIGESYGAYLNLASSVERGGMPPTVDDERAASRLITLIGDLGRVAGEQGVTLSSEQQRLVQQSQALEWQRNLPEVYGASVGGGILALRQTQRQRAVEAWEAKPQLRHPDSLIGRSDGGPGEWAFSPRRSGGEDFQEAVTGVPRGIEYRVGDVYLDGYDAARRVAIDAKDWKGYPPPGTAFWEKGVIKEANSQLAALKGTGVQLEWQVSTQQAANQVRAAFQRELSVNPASPVRDVKIVVVKP
jgi:hypothetical protein